MLFKEPIILRYSALTNGTTLKSSFGVVQGRWKWRYEKPWYGFLFAFHSTTLYHFLDKVRYWSKITILPRDAMHKRGLCRHAVSVRPSSSYILSKRIKISSKFFHRLVATSFHIKRHSNTTTGSPLTGASNAGGVGRNRDSEPISGFTACC